jgi:creatinine amidohydrolase/Fe(II)-dependent formamide hydrolase-like protein
MTWPEVAERAKEDPLTPVLVMFSSTEQHGTFASLNTDSFISWNLWLKAAERVADEVKPVITPLVPYDVAFEHMGMPGTITFTPETIKRIAKEIVRSLYLGAGFKKFCIVPGCGGGRTHLYTAVTELYEEFGPDIVVCLSGYSSGTIWQGGDVAFAKEEELEDLWNKMNMKSLEWYTEHMGEYETSVALALGHPDLYLDKAQEDLDIKPEYLGLPEGTDFGWFKKVASGSWPLLRWRERGPEVTGKGYAGYPRLATKEKGELAVEFTVEVITRFLKWFKKVKLPTGPKREGRYI